MSVVEAASPHLGDFLRAKDEDAIAGRCLELAGLVLDRQPSPLHAHVISVPPSSAESSRTLLDIIRDEEPNSGPYKRLAVGQGHHGKDRKSWKLFKDRLRLRRAGVSTGSVPLSDFPASKTRISPVLGRGSARFDSAGASLSEESNNTRNSISMEEEARNNQASGGSSPNSMLPGTLSSSSTRFGTLVPISIEPARSSSSPEQSLRPQIIRHNSTRYGTPSPRASLAHSGRSSVPCNIPGEPGASMPAEEPPRMSTRRLSVVLAEEREQSEREAAAAQEAAGGQQPVRMSLMDLLEETDRQMGLSGTRYVVREEDEAVEDGEEESGDIRAGTGACAAGGGVESNCCVCMVRHKGAAFIPCGHTFCRLCSRELWVSRGNCPLCNNYIVEILDIF